MPAGRTDAKPASRARLAPGKMAGRFLLTLNVLDEFGFRPGRMQGLATWSNPAYAHHPLYEDVECLRHFQRARTTIGPVPSQREVRALLEDSYGRYTDVATLLAVAEEEVILFSRRCARPRAPLGLEI